MKQITDEKMADYRILALASDGTVKLTRDEWRLSRKALVRLIKKKMGVHYKHCQRDQCDWHRNAERD